MLPTRTRIDQPDVARLLPLKTLMVATITMALLTACGATAADEGSDRVADHATSSVSTIRGVNWVTSAKAPSVVPAVNFSIDALGNLKDLYKDLNDMNDAINDGSSWRLMTNDIELAFNIGQLAALDPPSSIASDWLRQFGLLEKSIDAVSDGISNDASFSQLKARVAAAKKQTLVVYRMVRRQG